MPSWNSNGNRGICQRTAVLISNTAPLIYWKLACNAAVLERISWSPNFLAL